MIGYFTEAWNPPKNWVSPERIALARIPARPRCGQLKNSQFGFGKRLINGTMKVLILNQINAALKVVDIW